MGDLTRVSTLTLRRGSVSNLLKLGHCAPTVMQALADNSTSAIPEEARQAFGRLYAHFVEQDFHCAQAVLAHLGATRRVDAALAPRRVTQYIESDTVRHCRALAQRVALRVDRLIEDATAGLGQHAAAEE